MQMSENSRVVGATGGALGLSAFAAIFGACCVAPWTVGLFGVAGAVALARLSFLQPYFLVGAAGLLAVAFWWTYRRPAACADDSCETVSRRPLRWLVWCAAALTAILAAASLAPFAVGYLAG